MREIVKRLSNSIICTLEVLLYSLTFLSALFCELLSYPWPYLCSCCRLVPLASSSSNRPSFLKPSHSPSQCLSLHFQNLKGCKWMPKSLCWCLSWLESSQIGNHLMFTRLDFPWILRSSRWAMETGTFADEETRLMSIYSTNSWDGGHFQYFHPIFCPSIQLTSFQFRVVLARPPSPGKYFIVFIAVCLWGEWRILRNQRKKSGYLG